MGFGVGLLLHAKIANKNVTAKFLSSECREKLVFTLLSRDKIRLKVKFSSIKNLHESHDRGVFIFLQTTHYVRGHP
jgi:hypothetical protein